ncbi:MAG: hypothetical protein LBB20_02495 [Puniceicoccales bacterium]|jgi:hypothetical protein|nr:hypothetical protein [Puniceicoccales bacterium]
MRIAYLVVDRLEVFVTDTASKILKKLLSAAKSTIQLISKLATQIQTTLLSIVKSITKSMLPRIKSASIKLSNNTRSFVTSSTQRFRGLFHKCLSATTKLLSNITRTLFKSIASAVYFFINSIVNLLSKFFITCRKLLRYSTIKKILSIKINTKPFTDAIKNITLKPLRSIATVVTKLYYALRSIPLSCYHGIRKILSIKINTKPFTNAIKNITIFAVSSACIILTVGLVKEYRQPIAKILASTQGNANPPKNEYDLSKDQKIYVANSLITPKRKAKHLFRDPVEIKQRTVTEAILALKIDSIQRTANNKGNIQIGNKFYSIGAIINDHPRLKLAKITTNNVKFSDKYGYIYKRRIDDLIE